MAFLQFMLTSVPSEHSRRLCTKYLPYNLDSRRVDETQAFSRLRWTLVAIPRAPFGSLDEIKNRADSFRMADSVYRAHRRGPPIKGLSIPVEFFHFTFHSQQIHLCHSPQIDTNTNQLTTLPAASFSFFTQYPEDEVSLQFPHFLVDCYDWHLCCSRFGPATLRCCPHGLLGVHL